MARSFDGSSDKIEFGAVSSQMAQGSISLWFMATTLPASTDRDVLFTFVGSGVAEPSGVHDKDFFINSSGIMKARIYDGATKIAAATTAVSVDEWHHACMTFDGSNLRMYLDGVLEATTAAGDAYALFSPSPACRLSPSIITLEDGETTTTRFIGRLCELGIWISTILTANEIAALARGVSPRKLATLPTEYAPVWGLESPEPNLGTNRSDTGTLTGTAQANHAPVLPVTRGQMVLQAAAAAGGFRSRIAGGLVVTAA